jgi:pilus assembly protein Flp/PilA
LWRALPEKAGRDCFQHLNKRRLLAMIRSFFAKEDGQGLVEYALILVLIGIVVIGILTLLGGKVSTVFSSINSGLK